MDPSPTEPPAADPAALAARERLVAAMLAARVPGFDRLILCHHDAHGVLLVPADCSLRILFVTIPQGASHAGLQVWLPEIIKLNEQAGAEMHLVAVGGDDETAAILRRAVPQRTVGSLRCYHLGTSGAFTPLGIHELPVFRAARELTNVEPLGPEQIAAALAEQATLHKAAVGLSGRVRVTAALTAACVLYTGLELWWGRAGWFAVILAMGANSGVALQQGEYWRLFSSAFMHGGIFHLFVNMFALWSFGPVLESMLGARRYLILYGLSALGGSLASGFLGDGAWSVGASGAIWGLMAAGLSVAYLPRGLLPPLMVSQLRKQAWLPLLMNLVYSFQPGVDMLAHLGGGVVGFVLVAGLLTRGLTPVAERAQRDKVESGPALGTTLAAGTLVVAMLGSVITALAVGRPWELGAPLVYQRVPLGDTGLTAELPARVAESPGVLLDAGLPVFTFGNILHSNVVFELIVEPLPPGLGIDPEAQLEQDRKALDQASFPGLTRAAPAERVTLGGRPAVFAEFTAANGSVRVHAFKLDRHIVVLRQTNLGEVPAVWASAADTIAASLVEPAAP